MIVVLPLILTLLVLGGLRGGMNLMLLFPVLFLGAGAVAVMIAEKDMRARRSRSVRVLPTGHLSRKMRSALTPERSTRPTDKAASLKARGPGRAPRAQETPRLAAPKGSGGQSTGRPAPRRHGGDGPAAYRLGVEQSGAARHLYKQSDVSPVKWCQLLNNDPGGPDEAGPPSP